MSPSRLAVGHDGLVLRAYPGAGSVLLAFDVPDALQEDLAGFAVEVTAPGADAQWLVNRLTFTDPITAATTPTERQQITTTTDKAPLQKFHWAHFPPRVVAGEYTYRATAMLFRSGSEIEIEPGPQASVSVDLSDDGFADCTLGFTRG